MLIQRLHHSSATTVPSTSQIYFKCLFSISNAISSAQDSVIPYLKYCNHLPGLHLVYSFNTCRLSVWYVSGPESVWGSAWAGPHPVGSTNVGGNCHKLCWPFFLGLGRSVYVCVSRVCFQFLSAEQLFMETCVPGTSAPELPQTLAIKNLYYHLLVNPDTSPDCPDPNQLSSNPVNSPYLLNLITSHFFVLLPLSASTFASSISSPHERILLKLRSSLPCLKIFQSHNKLNLNSLL